MVSNDMQEGLQTLNATLKLRVRETLSHWHSHWFEWPVPLAITTTPI